MGVEHLIFKAMSCEQPSVTQTSLQSYVNGDQISPSAKHAHKVFVEKLSEEKIRSYKKPSFASNCRDIKESDIRLYKIKSCDFKHLYESFQPFCNDFQDWLKNVLNHSPRASKQIATNLREIWLLLDPTLSLYPNKLADTNMIEDNFFIPYFTKIKDDNLSMNRSKSQLKPTTLSSKLSSLRKMIEFSTSRQLYIGIIINIYLTD